MKDTEPLRLNVNPKEIHTYEEYTKVWDRIPPVEVTLIERKGGCKHEVGDSFIYKNHRDRPPEICASIHHVLELYLWRAALGFPSCAPWEPDDHSIYRVHCPAVNGSVWELKRKINSSQITDND